MKVWYRGLVVCELSSPDGGWTWQPLVSVNSEHPVFGSHFVELERSGHALYHIKHVPSDDESFNKRWWFSFNPNHEGDEDAVTRQVKDVSDELTVMKDVLDYVEHDDDDYAV